MSDPSPDTRPDADWARCFADLSHDVRAIAGGAVMSLDAFTLAKTDADRERTTDLLRSSMRRMVRLADDLRDVADVLAAPAERPGVEHDLVLAARRACDRLAGDAALRRIELAFEADVAAHVVTADPQAWDRALERLVLAGVDSGRRGERLVVGLAARPSGLELEVPYGGPDLPPDGALCASWVAARNGGAEIFSRGLWLARVFLAAQGGGLAVRGEAGERRLVATLPSPGTLRV